MDALTFNDGLEAAAKVADAWAIENRLARDRARVRGQKRFQFDGDQTHQVMAEQLDGAAIECNAIAEAIRKLKLKESTE